MIYTPQSAGEMEVVSGLIAASYDFVAQGALGEGADEEPAKPIIRDIRKPNAALACPTC